MRHILNKINFLIVGFLLLPIFSWAQDTTAPAVDPTVDLFTQVVTLIKTFGGLTWMAKVSAITLILVASMKVTFIKPFWEKLGKAQVLVAPFIALVGGILSQGSGLTWASFIAYVGVGGLGAVAFHEFFDALKALPGLGSAYVTIINLIETFPLIGSGGSTPKPTVQ